MSQDDDYLCDCHSCQRGRPSRWWASAVLAIVAGIGVALLWALVSWG